MLSIPHCDFQEQQTAVTEDGRLRPDVVIRLAGGRSIVVDSKVPLEAYLDSLSAVGGDARETCLKDHARQVRTRQADNEDVVAAAVNAEAHLQRPDRSRLGDKPCQRRDLRCRSRTTARTLGGEGRDPAGTRPSRRSAAHGRVRLDSFRSGR